MEQGRFYSMDECEVRIVRKHARQRREIADISVDDAEPSTESGARQFDQDFSSPSLHFDDH